VTPPPLEGALTTAVRWLLPALAVSGLLLALPSPGGSLGWVMLHLAIVVSFGLALTMTLGRYLGATWFPGLGALAQRLAVAATLVVLTTGTVALVTLASSAALRLEPSLQFLQLLSALDIAWAAGATALGLEMLAGRRAGWAGGITIVVICLWSVWRYLDVVGFTPTGGWLVDGRAMWTYILPYDMMAAAIAIASLTAGARTQVRTASHPPPGEQIWVEDDRIVRQRGEDILSARVTTLAKACEFLGIPYREQWFDRFHDPLAPVGADARLDIEPGVARALDAWQEFARVALEEARRLGAPGDDVTELQLWPEHFDQAFEMGSQAEGRRASYGASPGDDQHPEPYLYVAPWLRAERNDPYWNDPAFSGASLPYAELLTSRDPVGLAHGFFARGFSLLSR
jgi:hypothetical protein